MTWVVLLIESKLISIDGVPLFTVFTVSSYCTVLPVCHDLFPLSPPQLEHARMTQTELMRESFRHNQEMNELLQKQEELQERLSEEARAREQLALELHRAEGEFFWVELFVLMDFSE